MILFDEHNESGAARIGEHQGAPADGARFLSADGLADTDRVVGSGRFLSPDQADHPVWLAELPRPRACVTLNLPPSELSPNVRKGKVTRKKMSAVRAYRKYAGSMFTASGIAPWWPAGVATVRARFYHPVRRKRDRDNAAAMLKPAWDGLQDAGIVRDDFRLFQLVPELGIDKKNPRVEIDLWPFEIRLEVAS